MDLRLRALHDLDPHAATLLHGNEVTTRVERLDGSRVIPQGTIGRVTRILDDVFEVTFVGLGTFRYVAMS